MWQSFPDNFDSENTSGCCQNLLLVLCSEINFSNALGTICGRDLTEVECVQGKCFIICIISPDYFKKILYYYFPLSCTNFAIPKIASLEYYFNLVGLPDSIQAI